MTIIAAMLESQVSLLIGADSGQTEEPSGVRSLYLHKLQRHPKAILAWGAAGNPSIGITGFSTWLQNCEPFDSWESLREATTRKLATLNGEQRKLNRAACLGNTTTTSDSNTASVLLAGWIDRPGILELHADASWNFDSTGFHVIGMYVGDVQIAHATAQRVAPTGVRIQEFHAILDVCASALPQCNPPVHIYRLRSDGIEELDNTKW